MEYECTKCDCKFNIICRNSENSEGVACPLCGALAWPIEDDEGS